MKKRFFNALILGAVLLSTGAVTSCKDYDDDINNLQSQIDKLQALEQLKADVATLSSAVSAAQSDATKALADAAKAQTTADSKASKEQVADLQKAVDEANAAVKGAQSDLATAKEQLQALIDKKADKADLEVALARVAEAELAIKAEEGAKAIAQSALDALNGKADKLDIARIDNVLYDLQQAIDAANKLLEGKATQVDLANLGTQIYDLQQAVDAQKLQDAAFKKNISDINTQLYNLNQAVEALGNVQDSPASALTQEVVDALIGTTETASLAERVQALEAAVGTGDGENVESYKETLKALQEDAAALKIAVSQMITSVELFGTVHEYNHDYWNNNACDHTLTFTTITEQTNVFTAPDNTKLEFNKDNYTTYGDSIVVRVTPSNAVLTKEMISLINSQNAVLQDVEVESVEQFNTLLTENRPTRAVNNTGLWTIKFNLKNDYNAEAFKNATIVKEYENGWSSDKVLFAVAVKTRLGEDDVRSTRNVVSEYDLDMAVKSGVRAKDFTVNGMGINNLKNRFEHSEAWKFTNGLNGDDYVEDLTWAAPSSDLPTPAVAIVKTDNASNVIEKKAHRYDMPLYYGDALIADNRQNKECLAVEVGKPIEISYDYVNDDWYNKDQKVAGFYVTLDEGHAVESGVSEINAWHSYKYTGLNTMLGVDENGKPTNKGVITIENLNNVKGDIIGFRVYAVNLDGTLLDPDGRAFYVAVGDVATTGDVAAGQNVQINGFTGMSPIIELGTDVSVGDNAHSWKASDSNPKYGYNGSTNVNGDNESPVFSVKFFEDADGKKPCDRKKAKYVQYVMSQPWLYVDGATYTQTMVLYDMADDNRTELPVKTITATMTKVMPTDVPSYSFIPGQQLNEKNEAVVDQEYNTGKFRAYLVPNNGYDVTNTSSFGKLSMGNVLYKEKLNGDFQFSNLKFNFKKVALDGDKDKDLEAYGEADMFIPAKRIDNKTEYNVDVTYVYRNISTKWNAEANKWEYAVDYPVETGKNLTAIFACWHQASTFEWNKVGGKAWKPSLQWKQTPTGDITGNKVSAIVHTNSYDNITFGSNLAQIVFANKYLSIKENSAKLKIGDQVNPYFDAVVTIEGDIVFKQTQTTQAPGITHDETLSFVVVDAYGHEKEITLPVEIKKP